MRIRRQMPLQFGGQCPAAATDGSDVYTNSPCSEVRVDVSGRGVGCDNPPVGRELEQVMRAHRLANFVEKSSFTITLASGRSPVLPSPSAAAVGVSDAAAADDAAAAVLQLVPSRVIAGIAETAPRRRRCPWAAARRR